MKTIGHYISLFRGLIEDFSRTEPYTDEFLYGVLSVCRAEVIKQRLDKFVNVSADNWFRMCFTLEVTTSHNCNCVPAYLSCRVLRTVFKVPQVLSGRNKSKLQVSLLDGTNINIVTEAEWMRIKDNEFKSRFYYASLVNGHLYFWNLPLNKKIVEVYGLFADPAKLADISCNEMTGGDCVDVYGYEFPIDEELSRTMLRMAIEMLGYSLQNIADKTNDNNEDIR